MLLVAELEREFPEVESIDYDNKMLRKKANSRKEILQKLNYQNPNGIKHGSDPRILEAAETPIQEKT